MNKLTSLCLLIAPLLVYSQKNSDLATVVNRSNYHEINLLGSHINTERPEIAPLQYASKLYYTSEVFNPTTRVNVNRVFTTTGAATPVLIEKNPEVDLEGMAHVALTNTGDRIYYTIEKKNENGALGKSQIYYRDKNYHGRWGAPRLLPKNLGLFGNKALHPAIGILRDTREQILFFVSDRPGGKGGMDIWASIVKGDDTFSDPVNLSINTIEDEASPYFDNIEQALFFSSKGHLSLGGFDILRAKLRQDGTWSNPENMGRPINSYYDDLFFTLQNRDNRCYFSSDRPNETCPPNELACRDFDIYEAKLKVTLKVFVFEEQGNTILEGCNVELLDMQTAEVLHTYLHLENNFVSFGLDPNKIYQVIVSKKGYYPVFQAVSPVGVDAFRPLFQEVFLKRM